MSDPRGQYMKPGTPPPPTTTNAAPETPAVGALTGLPLSKFATAELIAKARAAGFDTLWAYVEHLERITSPEHFVACVDPTHDGLGAYVRHDDDCMKPVTGLCSCGLDQVDL